MFTTVHYWSTNSGLTVHIVHVECCSFFQNEYLIYSVLRLSNILLSYFNFCGWHYIVADFTGHGIRKCKLHHYCGGVWFQKSVTYKKWYLQLILKYVLMFTILCQMSWGVLFVGFDFIHLIILFQRRILSIRNFKHTVFVSIYLAKKCDAIFFRQIKGFWCRLYWKQLSFMHS